MTPTGSSTSNTMGFDHLAVDYRVVDVEHSCHLRAERLETAQDVAVARDEAATALLDVAQRTWLTRPADRGSTSCSACRGAPATWPSTSPTYALCRSTSGADGCRAFCRSDRRSFPRRYRSRGGGANCSS